MSHEKSQEDRSHGQLQDWLARLGWNANRLPSDLGEDLLVQIYDDGVSTGLTFLVQLKSTTDAMALESKRSPGMIRYALEVKDLLHWEVSTTPVVLILWDVHAQHGYWQPVQAMVRELDERSRAWRRKVKVTASVPRANETTGDGARRLRWAIAKLCHAIIPKKLDEMMKCTLSFPNDEEGRVAVAAFERALDMGESVELDGRFVSELQFPEWHRRAYGDHPKPDVVEILPIPSKEVLRAKIEIESKEGHATIPYVELDVIRQGRNLVTLTNGQRSLPLHVELTFDKAHRKLQIAWQCEQFTGTVSAVKESVDFLLAAGRGGLLRLTDLQRRGTLAEVHLPKTSSDVELRDLAARRDLLERLCFIQRRMARHGALEIKDDLSGVDIETIHRMFRICKDGHIDGNFSVSAMIPPSATPARGDPNGRDVRLILEGGRVRLLNIEIPIGKVRVLFNDPSQFLQAYVAAQRQATLTGKAASLRLNNVPAIQEYLEWLPQRSAEDRLHDVAVVQAGYFTRNQARESGLDPDTLGAITRIEHVAAGIYRFVQFPPSEHEDLMVLWLQTNRRAVISHDSALALHGLSDVLPSKRHITLPSSCEIETEGVQAGVVVHRGMIGERDVMWIASVPVTTPLRTVLDCVAAGLPKEHLERAVADGLERGLFTRADLPEIATARSA